MDSSSTEIKSENISDIEENELPECIDTNVISYLYEVNTENGTHPLHDGITCKVEETQISFGTESTLEKPQNSSEFGNGKDSVETKLETNNDFDKHSHAQKVKTEREEDINRLPERIDANVIYNLDEPNTESGTHPLHDCMTCKIEETQISFGVESTLEKVRSSLESANGMDRSERKLPNWLDGREKCTSKEELTAAKRTSRKCSDRPKSESFVVGYSLECDTATKGPPYKCPDCDKMLLSTKSLRQHQIFQHSTHKPHKCFDCDTSFATKQYLERHQMSRHSKLKPNKCPDCEKRFAEKAHLNYHQMSQHSKLRPHKCPDCEKSFVTKSQRDRHQMARHLKLKPHKCSDCEKSFATKHQRNRHQICQHSKLKPHKCPECEKSFIIRYELHRHQIFRHSRPNLEREEI